MTKADFLKEIWRGWNDMYSEVTMYDFAYNAQYVTDDEELVELAKTCLVSTEDLQDYIQEAYDALEDSSNTV